MYQKISIGILVLWFLGFAGGVGGQFIHLLFITSIIVLLFGLISRSAKPMPKLPNDNNFSGR